MPEITRCSVPEFLYFQISDWQRDQENLLREIASKFGENKVIVRSSAMAEDGAGDSMAGMFTSVPDVRANERDQLFSAVEQVIASYRRGPSDLNPRDHILVQLMISQVEMSGVLFTQDLNTGAPYYVISYDEESGRTDTVTGGSDFGSRTLYVHRGALQALRSPRFRELVGAVLELEDIIGSRALDVEFAIDKDLAVHLFQVRRITNLPNWDQGISVRVDTAIQRIQSFVSDRFKPWPYVRGHQSVFGQMPDWNPAEMIGRTPRPLALSLYRRLITDRVWRVARRQMGYAEPLGIPLMVSLGGQPYIDVRLSFHSYLPADLPEDIGEKLVCAWLNRLIENHALHDKVEFDVAVTALTFDFDERVAAQFPDALDGEELDIYRQSLRRLTNDLLNGTISSIQQELAKIETLSARQKIAEHDNSAAELGKIASLLEYCTELGTLPFSILARHGFIAQALFISLEVKGVYSKAESEEFLRSIRTVAGEFADDTRGVANGEIDRDEFMRRYGHLRPGTYDILSARYDQRENILATAPSQNMEAPAAEFILTAEKSRLIQACLTDAGLEISPQALIDYIRQATAAREYAKFVFSRNISDALEGIASWGEQLGLSREVLSQLTIDDILECMVSADGKNVEQHLRDLSGKRLEQYRTTQALRLPQLLFDEEGVRVIPLQVSEPNFITLKNVSGACVRLSGHEDGVGDLVNKIVLIENADPGFDWIFAHPIVGLVTKYGGVNSHMAIRCAEFGLPAAIGCGEQIFNHLSQANAIEIKCADGQIHRIEH